MRARKPPGLIEPMAASSLFLRPCQSCEREQNFEGEVLFGGWEGVVVFGQGLGFALAHPLSGCGSTMDSCIICFLDIGSVLVGFRRHGNVWLPLDHARPRSEVLEPSKTLAGCHQQGVTVPVCNPSIT